MNRRAPLAAFGFAWLVLAAGPALGELYKPSVPDLRPNLPVPGQATPGAERGRREPERPRLWRSGEDYFDVEFHDWGAAFQQCDDWGIKRRFPFGTLIEEDGRIEGEIYWEVKTPSGRRQFVQPFTGSRAEKSIVLTYQHPVWDGSTVVFQAATLRLSYPY